jgi:hypothetical protein
MLAATLAACGSDGADKSAGDGDGDDVEKDTDDVTQGNGDGDGSDVGSGDEALCELASGGGLGPYEGVRTWTQDDFLACREACPNFDEACIGTSCAPGFETFGTCVGIEVNACESAPEGPCRAEFEAHICCADEKCDLNDAAAGECVAEQCAPTRDAYLDCGESGGIEACIATAVSNCLAAPAEDPAPTDGATDGATTIPNEVAAQILLGRSSWRLPSAQSPMTGSAE